MGGARSHVATRVFDSAARWPRGTILGRVAASGKLRPWAADAVDGSEKARAVLTADVVALATGDVAARVLVAGDVARSRLVIAADVNGDGITAALIDQLSEVGDCGGRCAGGGATRVGAIGFIEPLPTVQARSDRVS